MGLQQFADNASSILAASISNVATTVQLSTGDGALFPSLTGAEYFMVAVEDVSGDIEIMKCTSISGDILTVVRGQESTSAIAFTQNLARVEVRDTAGTLAAFVQKSGDTMTGTLNMGSHSITNGVLGSGSSVESAVEIVDTPIRGATGASGNQLAVPTDGTSRATASGLPILCQGDPLPAFTPGMVMAWYGAEVNIPAGWGICDGTIQNGFQTPDLRNKFVIGAGLTYPLGNAVGAAAAVSDTGTLNLSSLTTDAHALAVSEMPSHTHEFWAHTPANYSGSGTFQTYEVDAGSSPSYVNTVNGNQIIQSTGGPASPGGAIGNGVGHSHTLTGASGSHTHNVATLPPSIALYWIVYVGV